MSSSDSYASGASGASGASVRSYIMVELLPEDLAVACTADCTPERYDNSTVRPHEPPAVERGRPGTFRPFDVPARGVTSRTRQPTVAQSKSFDNDDSGIIVPCSALYSYAPTVTSCGGRNMPISFLFFLPNLIFLKRVSRPDQSAGRFFLNTLMSKPLKPLTCKISTTIMPIYTQEDKVILAIEAIRSIRADSRGFPLRLGGVENMANLLLRVRNAEPVGKR
ncbi:hypothetical protein BDP81DRAFT_16639 [Colletotrichum phormii]|uniref:Uncharacterized protein n=1 Tax=Colletotrichum phormii TaxID=359342 RepID=A0AAJ0A462_9PEZI|nr:uncharacterized protein BDP81DRAFT_16639 [Colletotrichum phormii]KAK1656169.1 hypothetical protein BDP81DRAFT_16639 [Colletotrichum phormii]